MNIQEYITFAARNSQRATIGTGLFPSVMIAQLIVESGLKPSTLAMQYNNYFGIKADSSWEGERVAMRTREVAADGSNYYINDYFRVYSSPYQSFADRVKFLKENSRYAKAGVFTAKTPESQAQALQNAGYAGIYNKSYAPAVIDIINKYDLKKYDTQMRIVGYIVGVAILASTFFVLQETKIVDFKKIL